MKTFMAAPPAASAARMAAALAATSADSRSGTESATIPAPACTWAMDGPMTAERMVMAASRSSGTKKPMAPPYGPRRSPSSSAMACMARTFGAPLTVPAGKAARRASKASRSGAEPAVDLADEVHDVAEALDGAQDRDGHGAGLRHAADVVARQVHEHGVLGQLLLVGAQLLLQGEVALRVLVARPRAGDGPRDDLAVADTDQQLGRGAHQRLRLARPARAARCGRGTGTG